MDTEHAKNANAIGPGQQPIIKEIKAEISHYTDSENKSESNLLANWELQAPHVRHWQNNYRELGYEVDNGNRHISCIRISTVSVDTFVPIVPDRYAN